MTDSEPAAAGRQRDRDVEAVGETARRVVESVEDVIVGHPGVIEHILTAMFAGGHVLLEDVPGVGKTMLSRSIAASFDSSFKRVQFTPDLLPADVTGASVYNQQTQAFEFRPGPIFANVVLGDEINRAPPKTQSALLEAMEEGQVTADGETHAVPQPFTVIATQNTVERDRTYDLPMAELDRFTKKLELGYPDEAEESAMLEQVVGDHPIEDLEPVATLEDLERAREVTANVTVEKPVRDYITRLSRYTREHADLGASPRASLLLLRAAQGRAVLEGRDYVIPDDVQTEIEVVFPHRIKTGFEDTGSTVLLEETLDAVAVE
ncbi:MoxR family ATPase [Halorhabdus sp. CBA1104]|uniref:AAA family ATPase n=1 Tax=unclassified Halorhabdus TaxID=2621901 RepID=UPI0012B291D8|nr:MULTISPECIES: MoxR family ATPase [unclassified Halorhabdus]QGN05970.1 MoxR family ATPase [Halorhabdus sp. CBA1104]